MFRSKKQRVEALQDNSGNWIADPNTLKSMASNYFFYLYIDDTPYVPFGSNDDLSSLSMSVNSIEVRKALFDMGA